MRIKVKIIQHNNLSLLVYDKLKSMILLKQLHPGQKIIQDVLAEQMGVSRTPLRQALQMLESEFLVESIPRKGMAVKDIGLKDIIDVYDCREGLECVAVRLAAGRATPARVSGLREMFALFSENIESADPDRYTEADMTFHNALLELSENEFLVRMFRKSNLLLQIRRIGLVRPPKETLPEHMAIINALSAGDPEMAEREMKAHLRRSRNLIEKSLPLSKPGSSTMF